MQIEGPCEIIFIFSESMKPFKSLLSTNLINNLLSFSLSIETLYLPLFCRISPVFNIFNIVSGMISKLFTAFIGFIISIYILMDKENLARQIKKLLILIKIII